MPNTGVNCIIECPDLLDCLQSGHHGHLVVNNYQSQGVLFLLKLIKILSAAINNFLTIVNEMAIINKAHFLKDDPKGLYVVVHVVCADDAVLFVVE